MTKKKKPASKKPTPKKEKKTTKRAKKEPENEFEWMDLVVDDDGDSSNDEELDMLACEGFSLGDRLGTISKLETVEDASIPALAKKAGLNFRLTGSKISVVPEGQYLTIEELKALAEWLLGEANKAAEDYAIDFNS